MVGNLPVSKPARMAQQCQEPPPPLKTGARAELLANHAQAMKAYHECRELNREKAEWIEKVVPQ